MINNLRDDRADEVADVKKYIKRASQAKAPGMKMLLGGIASDEAKHRTMLNGAIQGLKAAKVVTKPKE